MTTYVALLRAVNVVTNPVDMGELRALLTKLGYENVRTYITSGNAIFDAPGGSQEVQRQIEDALQKKLKRTVKVIIRTAAEIKKVVAHTPTFLEKTEQAKRKGLHVVFLEAAPTAKGKEALAQIPAGETQYEVIGKHVYLYVPQGFAGTKIHNNTIEKSFGVAATTRSWGTVTKLAELTSTRVAEK